MKSVLFVATIFFCLTHCGCARKAPPSSPPRFEPTWRKRRGLRRLQRTNSGVLIKGARFSSNRWTVNCYFFGAIPQHVAVAVSATPFRCSCYRRSRRLHVLLSLGKLSKGIGDRQRGQSHL